MRRRPRIAITDLGNGVINRILKKKYAECVEAAGGEPVWVRWEEKTVQRVREYDGFLFPGGPDLAPSLYGEKASRRCGKTSPSRDRFERGVLSAALEAEKPVLGICRGFQLVAVVLGGSLHQDIRTDLAGIARNHRRLFRASGVVHSVTVSEGSLLAECVGAGSLEVNSLHHQAVASIPETLTVSAICDDGIIEGFESSEYPFLVAVQWHPEMLSARFSRHAGLFRAFVAASSG